MIYRGTIQATDLEKIIIALLYCGCISCLDSLVDLVMTECRIGRFDGPFNSRFIWHGEFPIFVDTGELSNRVIVEPIETQQQYADARGKCTETIFSVTVGFEEPVLICADSVLFCLIGAVQRGEIEIRGGRADIGIIVRRTEEI